MRALGNHADVRSALVAAGIREDQWAAYESALRSLADTDMIRPRESVQGAPA